MAMPYKVGDKPWPEIKIGNANHANTAVLIIGAGISGMCTAIDLIRQNNCRNFIIVEKSGGVGGTWYVDGSFSFLALA